MPGPYGPRRLSRLLATAVCLALLTAGCSSQDQAGGPGQPVPSPTAVTPTATTTPVDGETWCTSFRAFAAAQSGYVATPEDPAALETLQTTAAELLALRPDGLTEGGLTSLQELVAGSLPAGGAPAAAPPESSAAPADAEAFDAFLDDSCPA